MREEAGWTVKEKAQKLKQKQRQKQSPNPNLKPNPNLEHTESRVSVFNPPCCFLQYHNHRPCPACEEGAFVNRKTRGCLPDLDKQLLRTRRSITLATELPRHTHTHKASGGKSCLPTRQLSLAHVLRETVWYWSRRRVMVSAVTMHHTHLRVVDNQGRAEPPRYVQLGST